MKNDSNTTKIIVFFPKDDSFSRRNWYISELSDMGDETTEKYITAAPKSFYFDVVTISTSSSFGPTDAYSSYKEELTADEKTIIRTGRRIFAILRSNIYTESQFSLFGSENSVSEFSLNIFECKNDETPHMRVCMDWGSAVSFQLNMQIEMFEKIAKGIESDIYSSASVRFDDIYGMYECHEYTMMPRADHRFKILSADTENQPVFSEKTPIIEPPRFGVINSFEINLHTRRTLEVQKVVDVDDVILTHDLNL